MNMKNATLNMKWALDNSYKYTVVTYETKHKQKKEWKRNLPISYEMWDV